MFGLAKIWQSVIVPVLRRSGEEGSLVSRLWQRSPSRPGSDDAFSRPSNSMTTQRAVWPDDAAVGTRKPDRETHEPHRAIVLLYLDHILVKMGTCTTMRCYSVAHQCGSNMWLAHVSRPYRCACTLCTYHSRWTSPAAAPWSGSRPLPPSPRHSRAPPPSASTGRERERENRRRHDEWRYKEERWEHVVMETKENVVLLLHWEKWGRRRRWMNRGLFQVRGCPQWYFKSFLLIFNYE